MMEYRMITYQEASPFIIKWHYSKRVPSISYSFGAFDGNVTDNPELLKGAEE